MCVCVCVCVCVRARALVRACMCVRAYKSFDCIMTIHDRLIMPEALLFFISFRTSLAPDAIIGVISNVPRLVLEC